MKWFTFFWKDGHKDELEGTDPANALMLAGYGGGAVRALDFYSEGIDAEYKWDSGQWVK